MTRTWIDTHIHVSDIGTDGAKRENMLDDLLELLDRCDADLRLVISCDAAYNSMVRNDPGGMLKANSMIHDLVRQAPDRLHGSFETYPDNFWIEIRDFHCPALSRAIRDVPTARLLSGTDWTTRKGPPFQTYGTMFDVPESENPFPPGV
ncbi:MAG: hypothetical protein KAI66_13940, partial [Lentisphaeria bacterium]|nr:hypothetical protein [Lentisphaeria bacterium]